MKVTKVTKIRSAEKQGSVALWLNGQDAKDMLLPEGYVSLSKNQEILRCAYKIADLFSNMSIKLMENGDDGDFRVKNELSRLVDIAPSSILGRKLFYHKIVMDMIVYGNSVVFPMVNNYEITEFEVWDASQISFEKDGNSYLIRYKNKLFSPNEVLHFKLNPDSGRPYRGLGFAPMVETSIKNLLQANATKTGFLKSKWKPSLIISVNSDVEELQDKDKRSKILRSYTQTTETGEPWLIPAGEISINTVQPLTLNDLAIQESIGLDLKTVACGFGIAPFMVGIGNFNKEEYNNVISTTIMSFAIIIQQEFTRGLLSNPLQYFECNPKSLLHYNLAEKMTFVKDMVAFGMFNRNTGRGEFGYSPVNEPGMNEYSVLENYIKIADMSKQKKLLQEKMQEGGDKDE